MKEKIKQYKNLILLVTAVVLVIVILAIDPVGFFVERAHQRALIQNQIAIEKAETEKRIAIIQAEADAELVRIREGLPAEQTDTVSTDGNEEIDTQPEG